MGCLGHGEGAGTAVAGLEPGFPTLPPPPLQKIVLESPKRSGNPLTQTSLFHKAETKAQMEGAWLGHKGMRVKGLGPWVGLGAKHRVLFNETEWRYPLSEQHSWHPAFYIFNFCVCLLNVFVSFIPRL